MDIPCQFLIFQHTKKENAKYEIFYFFPFGRKSKQNIYLYFNHFNNKKKTVNLAGSYAQLVLANLNNKWIKGESF